MKDHEHTAQFELVGLITSFFDTQSQRRLVGTVWTWFGVLIVYCLGLAIDRFSRGERYSEWCHSL